MRLFSLVAIVATFASPGCASGGGGSTDAGRRDAPLFGFDVPTLDTPRPDAPGLDAPTDPTDVPSTIVRDTGIDVARPDTPGVDAPPECTVAADCNDGNACNGVERCEFGSCIDGPPPTCDDGIPCTDDTCAAAGCVYTPVSARCDDGVACTVDTCTATGCTSMLNDSLCPMGQRCTSTGCMGGSSCGESPCRLVLPQCGCSAGQACILEGGARRCATAGTRTEGQACTAATDCAAGLACVNFSSGPTPIQMCSRVCAGDSDCSGGGSRCLLGLADGTQLCTRACNPVRQTGCAPGLACAVYGDGGGGFVTDCAGPTGGGIDGASCLDDTDCEAGYLCIDVDGFGFTTCNHWCNAVTGEGCDIFTTCYPFTTPAVAGGVEYGVCAF